MKDMAKANEIIGEVHTYSASDSFATILPQSEAPLAWVGQSLGHTSISTPESYLEVLTMKKQKSIEGVVLEIL